MYKILRIICCVICALLLAACVFVFVYLGTVWGIVTVVAAAAFFALTMLFKGLQEDYEKKRPSQSDAPTNSAQQTETVYNTEKTLTDERKE